MDVRCLKCGYEFQFNVHFAPSRDLDVIDAKFIDHTPPNTVHLNTKSRIAAVLVTLFLSGIAATIAIWMMFVKQPKPQQFAGSATQPSTISAPPAQIANPGSPESASVPPGQSYIPLTYDQLLVKIQPLMNARTLSPEVTSNVLGTPNRNGVVNGGYEMDYYCIDGWFCIRFEDGFAVQVSNVPNMSH